MPGTEHQKVYFTEAGIYVNGQYCSGELIVTWLRDRADKGYVLKADAALAPAYGRVADDDRATEDRRPMAVAS